MPKYSWDTTSRRYRDTLTGHYVAATDVRLAIDDAIIAAALAMRDEARRLVDRDTTIAQWQRAQRDAIRDAHMWAAAAALGGWNHMTPSDYGRAGARIRAQYKYLQNFADQLESGDAPLDGRIPVRASQYAHAARATYEDTRRRAERDAGQEQERRLLHSHEGCSECFNLSQLGWQPIGSLPPIGDTICRVNCLCTFSYRKAPVPAS